MTKLTVFRTLTNAANRKKDQVFFRNVEWPSVPRAGDCVNCGVPGKADVDRVEYHMDGEVQVHLHADHRTFKADDQQKKFVELYNLYSNWDWQPQR